MTQHPGMRTLKVLSALLTYPTADLIAAAGELADVLTSESLLPDDVTAELLRFLDDLAIANLLDTQEYYVSLFDRNRSLSLHLYEHVHGESRDRGQAMVRLSQLYTLHGLEIDARELPDYLPLYLEFLSVIPPRAAASLLAEAVHVIAALRERLAKRDSPYAVVLRAIENLAARPARRAAIDEILATLKPEADSLEALDRQWEDEAVRFTAAGGPDQMAVAASCGR
jgi:nitrate reductase delta subunit